jgi:integrase
MGMAPVKTPGIRWTGHGWQVFIKVRGEFRSKHFPADTPPGELKAARAELRAHAVLGTEAPKTTAGPTLAEDCEAYLKAVRAMPTYKDRKRHIELWRDTLGPDRVRSSITSVEIRQHLETWRKTGKSNGTANTRLTALKHLWTILDGDDAANPTRSIKRYPEAEKVLSLPTPAAALKAIEAIASRGTRSKMKCRLRVLALTGWPSAVLKRLRPEDIHWKKRQVLTHGRLKGGGTRPATVPVTKAALAALRQFDKVDAYGDFSGSSMHSALHRGCEAAGVRPFRVYDLRHAFITAVSKKSKDAHAVMVLGLHSSLDQSERYRRQAADTRAMAAIRLME